MNILSLKNPYAKTLGVIAAGVVMTGAARVSFYVVNNRRMLWKSFTELFSTNGSTPAEIKERKDLRVYRRVTTTQKNVSILLGVFTTLGCAAYVTGLAVDLAERVSALRN